MVTRSIPQALTALLAMGLLTACDLDSLTGDGGLLGGDGGIVGIATTCNNVCQKVQSCSGAKPPVPQSFGNQGSSGSAGIDCAANCIAPDRARYGYSDCQLECLQGSSCGAINECWNSRSEGFAQYCLASREPPPPIAPPEDQEPPENETNTGSEAADELTEDPAVAVAINDGEQPVNVGNEPPIIQGLYTAVGSIDEASNARPVGSVINTKLCFWGQDTLSTGTTVSYCEHNVPGESSAPVTGTGDAFTIYLEFPGMSTILFSGSSGANGVESAEALVVYSYGIDVWEHSLTEWERIGDCTGCSAQ